MPELPEVETVRKGLERLVVGKTIQKVQVLWPKIIEQPETPIFEASLVGETIQSMGRRGKFLIFHLDHCELISHLRMEGKYQFMYFSFLRMEANFATTMYENLVV